MSEENKDMVVVVEDAETLVAESNDVLSPAELEMAKKNNVDISKFVDVTDDKEVKKVDNKSENKSDSKKEESKSDEIPVDELDSFEKLHDIYQSKPDAFYKLPKNIKQLYHSQKGLYKRMKDEEEKRKKVEDEFGLKKIQDSVARIKLDRIKNRLSNPEGLTVEELQDLLDEKKEVEKNDDKPLTAKDLEAIKAKEREEETKKSEEANERQEQVARRIQEAETIAKASIGDITGGKYDNFDDVVNLAQEMIKTKARYGAQVASIINSNSDVQEIIDVLVDIARLNPKWGTSEKTDKKTDKESVDKLVKNATRQATSASLTGGRGSREIHISEDMSPEEAYPIWDKIPRQVQRKILLKLKD